MHARETELQCSNFRKLRYHDSEIEIKKPLRIKKKFLWTGGNEKLSIICNYVGKYIQFRQPF